MTSKKLAIVSLAAALALPASAAAMPDKGYQDLRSPDAQDAAAQVQDQRGTDLRSPDAQDAADPVRQVQPTPTVATVQRTVSDGFDWGDAGIGASIMLGLLAIGGGAFVLMHGQRGRRGFRTS